MTAVQTGKYLAIIPITVDIYILWNSGNLWQPFPFGLQDTLGTIASTAIAWLIGLFTFGVLLPYLRADRAPIKGAVFGSIAFAAFAADAAVRHALGVSPYSTFVIDGLLAIALFATVGVLLDLRTVRDHTGDQQLISSLYRIGSMRGAVTYATTLIVVGVGIWQTVYLAGQTSQQRAQNFANTAQYVNGVAGTPQSVQQAPPRFP
jgi:hypothetical protein